MYQRITYIFSGFMIAMCFVMTYFMAFTQLFAENINGSKRKIFIVVLLGYAIYRAWRLKRQIENDKIEEHE